MIVLTSNITQMTPKSPNQNALLLRLTLLCAGLAMLLSACVKQSAVGCNTPAADVKVSVLVDGKLFENCSPGGESISPSVTCTYITTTNEASLSFLFFCEEAEEDDFDIYLSLAGFEPGEYSLNGISSGQYAVLSFPLSSRQYETQGNNPGTLHITSIDHTSSTFSGSFQFVGYAANGDSLVMSGGTITGAGYHVYR